MSAAEISESWICRGLSESSKEKARVELNETEEGRTEVLDKFRQRIEQYAEHHKDVTFTKKDDAFLTLFLRARKYDVERALIMLVKYLRFREEHRELFEGVTLDSIRPLLENKVPFVLKQRDAEGRRVMLFQPARADFSQHSPLDIQRALVYVLDALILDEETQVNGFVLVEDYADMTFMKMMMFDQKLIKQVMELFQDAFPARFKAYHLIHQPWFFNIVWAIAKPFMKEKMRSRIHMHGSDMSSLHKAVSKEGLPAEVGGDLPPYDPQELLDFLEKVTVERPPLRDGSSV